MREYSIDYGGLLSGLAFYVLGAYFLTLFHFHWITFLGLTTTLI